MNSKRENHNHKSQYGTLFIWCFWISEFIPAYLLMLLSLSGFIYFVGNVDLLSFIMSLFVYIILGVLAEGYLLIKIAETRDNTVSFGTKEEKIKNKLGIRTRSFRIELLNNIVISAVALNSLFTGHLGIIFFNGFIILAVVARFILTKLLHGNDIPSTVIPFALCGYPVYELDSDEHEYVASDENLKPGDVINIVKLAPGKNGYTNLKD